MPIGHCHTCSLVHLVRTEENKTKSPLHSSGSVLELNGHIRMRMSTVLVYHVKHKIQLRLMGNVISFAGIRS